jgi:hypothetical protein
VDAGLWEQADGGWIIHDFSDYLPSPELRTKRAEAGRRGAEARWAKVAAQVPDEYETPDDDSNLPSFAIWPDGKTCPEPEPEPEPKNKKKTSSSSPTKRGSRIADDFEITDAMLAWGQENFPDVNGDLETQKFVDYWRAQTGARATKADWPATWRNWIRTAAERAPSRASPGSVRLAQPATLDVRAAQADAALASLKARLTAEQPAISNGSGPPDFSHMFREIEP